ncbi:hypothetical protein O9929_13630 [Vibrio lentus]|nr:hypothetical protein [Vibrio lentus]
MMFTGRHAKQESMVNYSCAFVVVIRFYTVVRTNVKRHHWLHHENDFNQPMSGMAWLRYIVGWILGAFLLGRCACYGAGGASVASFIVILNADYTAFHGAA